MKNTFLKIWEYFTPVTVNRSILENEFYREHQMRHNLKFGTILLLGGFVFEFFQAFFTLNLIFECNNSWLLLRYIVSISLFVIFTVSLVVITMTTNSLLEHRYRFFLFVLHFWLMTASIEDGLAYTREYKMGDFPITFFIALLMIFGAFILRSREIIFGVLASSFTFLFIRIVLQCPDLTTAILQLLACVLFVWGYEHKYRNNAVHFYQKIKIEEQAKKLREFNQLKAKLYTNLTHEFRTPLTIIGGINDNQVQHEQAKKTIRRNVNHLLKLVDQILQVAKIEANSIEPVYHEEDIIQQLRYVMSLFEGAAFVKQVHLKLETNCDGLMAYYDCNLFEQIMNNLISNAIKFTPKLGRIEVSIKAVNSNQIDIKVRDTGMGINQEDVSRIFDRYYQGNHSLAKSGVGAGIGLSIVQEYVDLLDGQISVTSEENKGTQFEIIFPFKNSILDKKTTQSSFFQSTFPEELPVFSTKESVSFSETLVLIIEDNHDMSSYIKTCLPKKYDVVVAVDGEEGMEKALKYAPDIIISDIMMPKLDGMTMSKLLRNDIRTSHIPVIILSAKCTNKDRLKSMANGVDVFLSKPFNKEELVLRISQILNKREVIKNYILSSVQNNEPITIQDENSFLAEVKKYIIDHLGEKSITTADLHKALHMSRSQFYKKMKTLTGMSPSEFKRSIQLNEAQKLLNSNAELTVAEIAFKVGYKHPSHFSRDFKKLFNYSPKEATSTVLEKTETI